MRYRILYYAGFAREVEADSPAQADRICKQKYPQDIARDVIDIVEEGSLEFYRWEDFVSNETLGR